MSGRLSMTEGSIELVPVTIKLPKPEKERFRKALDKDGRHATGLLKKWILEYCDKIEEGGKVAHPPPSLE